MSSMVGCAAVASESESHPPRLDDLRLSSILSAESLVLRFPEACVRDYAENLLQNMRNVFPDKDVNHMYPGSDQNVVSGTDRLNILHFMLKVSDTYSLETRVPVLALLLLDRSATASSKRAPSFAKKPLSVRCAAAFLVAHKFSTRCGHHGLRPRLVHTFCQAWHMEKKEIGNAEMELLQVLDFQVSMPSVIDVFGTASMHLTLGGVHPHVLRIAELMLFRALADDGLVLKYSNVLVVGCALLMASRIFPTGDRDVGLQEVLLQTVLHSMLHPEDQDSLVECWHELSNLLMESRGLEMHAYGSFLRERYPDVWMFLDTA